MGKSVIWLLSLHHHCTLLYLPDHSLLYCAATPCKWRPIPQKYFFVYKFITIAFNRRGTDKKRKSGEEGERESEKKGETYRGKKSILL